MIAINNCKLCPNNIHCQAHGWDKIHAQQQQEQVNSDLNAQPKTLTK